MHVCLLWILTCGTLTAVPLSTLPRSVICSLLLSLTLWEILLHAPITPHISVKGVGQIVLTTTNGKYFYTFRCFVCTSDQEEFAVNFCTW